MLRSFSATATALTTPTTPRRALVVILLVALAARAITFGNPIVHVDEQFYFVTAHAWLHGALPYLGVWDRKPIGLFLIYLPAAALGLPVGIWAYQAMALASLVMTARLIHAFACRAAWNRGALAGALAYVLWVNLVDGQGGQAPIFYNLLVVGAATLIAPGGVAGRWPRLSGVAAMALIGCALQIKYSVLFEGLFFGIWLLVREWRRRSGWTIIPFGVALVAVALVPTVAAWLAYVRIGEGDAWLYANLGSILARRPDPPIEQLANLGKIALILSPLIAAAILAWRRRGESPSALPIRVWLFAWLAAALFGLLIFGSYFEHYALPVMVPAAICTSGFFGHHRDGRRFALPLLLIVALGGQALLVIKRGNRGTPAQFATLARAIGSGSGCLYVYSGETMLYPASGRCALTRYLFPSHLGRLREQGATGVDQHAEIERILARAPEIVVLRPPYSGERAELRALVEAHMQRDYRLRATTLLGNQAIEVWARRDTLQAAPARDRRAAISPS